MMIWKMILTNLEFKMKINSLIIGVLLISNTTLAAENSCERIWNSEKEKYNSIKILDIKPCKQIWEDNNKAKLLKKVGLNAKNSQWMSTGECRDIEVDKVKYQVYQAYLKNDYSDIKIINDNNGNYFAFFRDLGKFDLIEDKFNPSKNANNDGVDLKCDGIGDFENLKSILSSYLNKKKIDIRKFTFEDQSK